jgi:hypothetical protein
MGELSRSALRESRAAFLVIGQCKSLTTFPPPFTHLNIYTDMNFLIKLYELNSHILKDGRSIKHTVS